MSLNSFPPPQGPLTTSDMQLSALQVNNFSKFGKVAVTQETSTVTPVTANAISGTITMVASTLAADAVETFTVSNNRVALDSVVLVSVSGYSGSSIPTVRVSSIASGSFTVSVGNAGAAALDAAVTVQFFVA